MAISLSTHNTWTADIKVTPNMVGKGSVMTKHSKVVIDAMVMTQI